MDLLIFLRLFLFLLDLCDLIKIHSLNNYYILLITFLLKKDFLNKLKFRVLNIYFRIIHVATDRKNGGSLWVKYFLKTLSGRISLF